jgi:polysaccharide export outer membrane protein
VYQVPDLTLEARLSEAGVISYPLLGSVRLGGLSVAEAEKSLADGLRQGDFVKQPQVSILVVQVRGNQASVLGQVNRPGRYPLETAGMRLTELLATAGGVAPGGADTVTLVGTRGGQPMRQTVDLPALFRSGQGADPLIQDGDAVYVERAPLVYIYGEVQRPGALRLERGMTLLQALAAGGGLTQRGTEKGIRVHRKNAQGEVQVLTPAMDDSVQEGDVVFVRESLF